MAEIIRMPRLSDTMEEGNIIEWLKKEGETVEPGDVLAEVETDKATMELESFFSGTLIHIGVQEGAVPVDGIIAIIGDPSDDVQKLLAEAQNDSNGGGASEAPSEESAPAPASAPSSTSKPASTPAPAPAASPSLDDRVKASPLAKKMAADAGIDISSIQGSGEGGRIVKRDVEKAKSRPAPASQSLSVSAQSDFQYGTVPVSQMRKTIARRLGESKFTAPHFYLTVEINMNDAVSARKQMNEFSEVRISFNDMVVKACALALKQHPQVNASWTGDSIIYHPMVNIGVAVAIDEGLVVPVINDANLKPLSMLNTEIKHLAGLARDRKLGLDQMQGNTFTISNLGMFDIEEFTAIINPPDSCILAVGSIIQKPIVQDGEIKVGQYDEGDTVMRPPYRRRGDRGQVSANSQGLA